MKIQSKFKDYYDVAMGQGTQDDIVFERKTVSATVKYEEFKKSTSLELLAIKMYEHLKETSRNFHLDKRFTVSPFIVAFCGKIYPGIHVERKNTHTIIPESENIDSYFYSLESVEACLQKQKLSLKDAKPSRWDDLFGKRDVKNLNDFFNMTGSNHFENDLLNNKIVTAVVSSLVNDEGHHFTSNLPLKKVEFFKKFDSWQAYQEISMYIGGVMAPESKPMIKIEDKYKIIEHGFDKMSFRKEPSKAR